MYFIALNGTTKYGLAKAIEAVAQKKLGHGFFPSPPELRGLCDEAMVWHERERERIRRRDREARERKEYRPVARSPEGAARVSRVYADFCKGYEKAAAEETFKLDPELVAQVADNPKALIHQRQGGAA